MAALSFIKRGRAGCAPYATAIPTVAGVRQVGQLATGSHGTYLYSPTSYTYRWLRNGVAIGGATALTYTYVADDAGCLVALEETAINAAGAGLPNISNEVEVVAVAGGGFPLTQTITFRDETLGGHGGHDLAYTGSGTISFVSGQGTDWAIDGNKHLVPTGAYGAARASRLAGPYTIVVTDGTDTSTVTVNILQHGATVRALPGETNTSMQWKAALASTQRRYGDIVDMRPGVYNPEEIRITLKRNTEPTQRTVPTTGPVKPTMPYHAWVTDATTKAGWIVSQPIEPDTVEVRYLEIIVEAYQDWCFRFTGLRCRRYRPAGSWATGTSIYVTSGGAIGKWGMFQFDNNDFNGNGRMDCRPSTGQNRGLFIFDNQFEQGQILVYASDSWVIGNEMQRVVGTADCMRHAMFKSAGGLDCISAFNFFHNKAGGTTNYHADGCQGDWTGTNAPGLPTGDVDAYWSIGNIYARGDGSGIGTYDFQPEFDADMPTTVRLKIVRVGAFAAADYGNGLTHSNAAPGSMLVNCGLIWDQSNGGVASSSPPRVRFDNEGQASANVLVKNCYAHTTVNNANTSVANPPGTIAFTDANNIWDISSATWSADFDAPATGSSLQTVAGIMAAFNPKAGGRLLPGGATEKIGPFGTGYINHVNRTATIPGVTLPYVPAYSA